MLKHNKLKPVGIAIRLMWNMDKWLLIHSIITSVIEAATPFAGILLSVLLQLPVPICVLPAVCVSPLLQILSQQLFHFLSLL